MIYEHYSINTEKVNGKSNAAGQELYNHTRMLTAWMSSLSFNSPEQVQGALWFLPVWLVSSGLFAGCVWFGRAAARFTRKDNVKLPVCAFACILIGLAGVFLNMRSCPLPYNLQAALLVVPVYLIAWLMQQFFSNFRHYTVWYGCLISALLLHLTNTKLHIFIDLASMHIPGVLFYPISIIGIYFVLSLSDLSAANHRDSSLLCCCHIRFKNRIWNYRQRAIFCG